MMLLSLRRSLLYFLLMARESIKEGQQRSMFFLLRRRVFFKLNHYPRESEIDESYAS